VALLCFLAATILAISLAMIFTLLHSYPVNAYLMEIILAAASGVFFLPVFKLFTYHLGLFFSRQTTNEDLKGLYELLNGPVPFRRCELYPRPPLAPIKGKMILSVERDERSSRDSNCHREQVLDKGKRYSTLVSDRQSVLNYLVETEL
jgi:hypothetical protein